VSTTWTAARWTATITVFVAVGVAGPMAALQEGPELALDALKQAYAALEAEDLVGAETAFRLALDRANTSELRYNALFGLGSVLAADGRRVEAEPVLAEATELRPDRASAWLLLGDLRRELQRPEAAARAWTSALAADPDLREVYTKLGVLYEELEQHTAAEKVFAKGAVRFPRDPEMLLGLGVARLHGGRAVEAEGAFRAALELDPGNARGVYGLGVAQLESGDREAATATHARLESLSPELADDLADRLRGD
jgi:tetratricopeptide (TPR) repeat protein